MKVLVLHLSSKYPITGIEVIREASRLSHGMWKPSPGTVYYLIKKLKAEGSIIEVMTKDFMEKAYIITEKGRERLEELRSELIRELKKQAVLLSLMMELTGVEDMVEAFKEMIGA